MDLSDYQRTARETSQLQIGGPQRAIAPMLGLASETGSILNIYKKYLRDGIDLNANRELLAEELGDLLWYAAAVASAFGLDLNEVANQNLARTRNRYERPQHPTPLSDLPVFDAAFPPEERFPRRLVFEFDDFRQGPNRPISASMKLLHADPNAFVDGPIEVDGKRRGFELGAELGDPLTDNSRRVDSYRYHDAVHIGFMAVLGWSPTVRSLLRLKRKSDPMVDEVEDGARAIFAEEGLAAVLARLAPRRMSFVKPDTVDTDTLDIATAVVAELEVEVLPGWLWRRAISYGFQAMSRLGEHGGGYLVADLDQRTLIYSKLPPS